MKTKKMIIEDLKEMKKYLTREDIVEYLLKYNIKIKFVDRKVKNIS